MEGTTPICLSPLLHLPFFSRPTPASRRIFSQGESQIQLYVMKEEVSQKLLFQCVCFLLFSKEPCLHREGAIHAHTQHNNTGISNVKAFSDQSLPRLLLRNSLEFSGAFTHGLPFRLCS